MGESILGVLVGIGIGRFDLARTREKKLVIEQRMISHIF